MSWKKNKTICSSIVGCFFITFLSCKKETINDTSNPQNRINATTVDGRYQYRGSAQENSFLVYSSHQNNNAFFIWDTLHHISRPIKAYKTSDSTFKILGDTITQGGTTYINETDDGVFTNYGMQYTYSYTGIFGIDNNYLIQLNKDWANNWSTTHGNDIMGYYKGMVTDDFGSSPTKVSIYKQPQEGDTLVMEFYYGDILKLKAVINTELSFTIPEQTYSVIDADNGLNYNYTLESDVQATVDYSTGVLEYELVISSWQGFNKHLFYALEKQ